MKRSNEFNTCLHFDLSDSLHRKAVEILELVNKGEDFDALIKEYGGDLFLFNNDDGYYISRGNYYKAFEDTAFSLEVG